MLEKAIITEVRASVDESVYRVEGVDAAALFETLAATAVNVDTIVQTSNEILFSAPRAADGVTVRALDELEASWSADRELGQVHVMGAGMRSHPAVTATALATLAKAGIEPVMVITSPIKITAHVPLGDVDRAVHALHVAFDLPREDGT
ncbi:MAG TPA: ACT domain-containing protein [Gaiellaceae bacterium]|nr:ACT domain-containing protein [Gaiellaceae bacterium]